MFAVRGLPPRLAGGISGSRIAHSLSVRSLEYRFLGFILPVYCIAHLFKWLLIGLGHQQIAEISGPLNWYDAIMRHQSWVDTMAQHGLLHQMSVEGNWTAQSGYEAVQTLLNSGAEFTGLVVANDQMALGAIAALNARGFQIPADVSVVGFDDIPESAYFVPALTTVHQDFEALGAQSVEYLVSLIRNPDTPIHQRVLYPQLIVRNSTISVK